MSSTSIALRVNCQAHPFSDSSGCIDRFGISQEWENARANLGKAIENYVSLFALALGCTEGPISVVLYRALIRGPQGLWKRLNHYPDTTGANTNKDIESTLECLLENGTAGSLSRLEIYGGTPFPPLFNRANSRTLDRLDEHLGYVRTLYLRNVIFRWKCAVFEQLNSLELEHLPSASHLNWTQLAELLSASPGLRYLALKHIHVNGNESTTHPPLRLQCLKSLTLHGFGDAGFQRVASILTLGGKGSYLHIDCDLNSSAMLEALRLLASGGSISALCLAACPKRQPLPEIIESLPNLKCLILGRLELDRSDFNALVRRNSLNNTRLASSPSPHSRIDLSSPLSRITKLGLVQCTIVCDQATLKEALRSLGLDIFHLWYCSIEVKIETRVEDGNTNTTTKILDIGATTELGIWLAENMTGEPSANDSYDSGLSRDLT
ncbi:hypothetical protein BDV93DRAFT_581830 [Ceratobasidium sp. AG-I]|nr:hypothetical protein BDV93DRAFT_581830 [Ceratobasidium sp. AG-I]